MSIKNHKEEVKSQEWYGDPSAIGKPVWVRDRKELPWAISILYSYNAKSNYPFVTPDGLGYRYAKPVVCDDLYSNETQK